MKIEFTDFIILFLICYIHNEYKIFVKNIIFFVHDPYIDASI